MKDCRILTIQDISCVGQCSITVALPILSACGIETCILPSAILSTHTVGFKDFECRDFTDEMTAFAKHWEKENIFFDALYTGYIACARQIDSILQIAKGSLRKDAKIIVDPAMADNGTLYPAFDCKFVGEMKKLCAIADVILPNVTEACLLTGTEYKSKYDESYINSLTHKLLATGAKNVVLTGVSYDEKTTGVLVCEKGGKYYYRHRRLDRGCHGTGDVFASAFVGASCNGKSLADCAKIAADFTLECIEKTLGDEEHWYGVKFEKCLKDLMAKVL